MPDYDRIKQIRDFESLVTYLRDDLEWPIDDDRFEDSAFDYAPEELGLDEHACVKINEIKQLRPLKANQPWGVFFVDFESRRLPVVVLRKMLRGLVVKKRAVSPDQPTWRLSDLLFISAMGEEDHRGISFAHFSDNGDGTPLLKTFSWDDRETHFHWLQNLNLESLRWPSDDGADADNWCEQWSGAFVAGHREAIGTSKELSIELARLACKTRDLVVDIYAFESKKGPLHNLYKSFHKVLIQDLDVKGFADMVAQTVAYGLLTARATGERVLGLKHLEGMVPKTNPFLRELFAELTKISGHGKHDIDFDEIGVSNLVDMLNAPTTNMEAILRDFGRQSGGGKEDPVVHFYELFLKEYDKAKKVKRGVFYTPKPVVLFIVRSVHKILKDEFGLKYGLADTTTWGEMAARTEEDWASLCHSERSEESAFRPISIPKGVSPDAPFVQVLDPATGTGTFLETVIDIIHETMVEKWHAEGKRDKDEIKAAWNDYVPKHLLPRLYGFELMMAPYAVAHLKLGLKLKETGYDFQSDARLQVYLTNTLEKASELVSRDGSGFLAHEAEAANKIKRGAPITVIIGNPPYSGISSNLTPELRKIIDQYRYVGSDRIKERGALQLERNLQEDYVKFYRYSEERILRSDLGVVGIVTSHGFLDSPSLRGMRFSLLRSFSKVSVVDLHGNGSRQANAPDGSPDNNVFAITRTGVAISLLRRLPVSALRDVEHGDVWGDADKVKYPWLRAHQYDSSDLMKLTPNAPFYLLVPVDSILDQDWSSYYSLPSTMPLHSIGIVTGRDAFVLDRDPNALIQRMREFATSSVPTETLADRYGLRTSTWWSVDDARNEMPTVQDVPIFIRRILYRPFDEVHLFYHPSVVESMRRPVMRNLADPDIANLLLITTRMTKGESFNHVIVSRGLAEAILLSSRTSNSAFCFPLSLQSGKSQQGNKLRIVPDHLFDTQEHLPFGESHTVNLSKGFIKDLCGRLKVNWREVGRGNLTATVGPEDVFNYIYAVLNSPGYRSRYTEFLARDFPRIPQTTDRELFKSLCKLGGELVGLHLMEKHAPLITTYQSSGGNVMDKVRYTEPGQGSPEGRVWINQKQYFEGVPPEVWQFHIGGYQVCEKWLKDRGPKKGQPGRTLTEEDIIHYQRVVAALKETIRVMSEIDEVIESHGGWPGAFADKTGDPQD